MKSLPKPRKQFGQHFFRDHALLEQFIRWIAVHPNDVVVEIGPGQGVLTERLLAQCNALYGIEVDRDLIAHLSTRFTESHFTLIPQDALTVHLSDLCLPQKIRLVGNLPYNISTPLLFHYLGQLEHILDMHFMLQEEVVDRMAATPNQKAYGRLSVMTQYWAKVVPGFGIPPGAFYPPPKVNSRVVRLIPYAAPPFAAHNFPHFNKVVQAAFSKRRKTLQNSLKGVIEGSTITALGIDPKRRPETLSVEEFVKLSNAL